MREDACMYGSDGRNKWHGKQDSQLSLSCSRSHPLCATDDDKGPTLSFQLSNQPKKMVQKKWWMTKQSLTNKQKKTKQRKKRQSKSLLLVCLSKEKIKRNGINRNENMQNKIRRNEIRWNATHVHYSFTKKQVYTPFHHTMNITPVVARKGQHTSGPVPRYI